MCLFMPNQAACRSCRLEQGFESCNARPSFWVAACKTAQEGWRSSCFLRSHISLEARYSLKALPGGLSSYMLLEALKIMKSLHLCTVACVILLT